jgi:hypothetical protein
MDVKDIEFKFAKYKISKFNLIIPGYDEPYEVNPARIGNWVIEKDYDNYLYPYLEFRCIVPDQVYSDVMEASEDVYVDLKIEYGLFEDIYEMDPDTAINMMGTILDTRFYAFIDNQSPKLTSASPGEKAKSELEDNDETSTQYAYDNNKSLVMGLYRSDHIFNSNQIINKVLSGATATDAVAYYMSKLGLSNVLMSPSDNVKTFDQLILPPLAASQGLLRTCNIYSLHKAGTTVFFDYDFIYVLNKKLGATAWINNEIKTVYLTSFPAKGDSATMKSGFYANGKEKYCAINIIGNSISVTNESMFGDQLVGGNILSINSNTGEVTTLNSDLKVSELSTSKKGLVNRVVVQDEGEDTAEHAKTTMEQSQKTLNIVAQDVNIRALSPNKDYIFTTDNTEYQDYIGHYRISNMAATFTKESSMYTVQVQATFVGGSSTI